MTNLKEGVRPFSRRHWSEGNWRLEDAEVVEEAALTLMVNGQEYVTVAITPLDVRDWVLGFLAGEGLIQKASDMTIFLWRPEDGQLWVRVPGAVLPSHQGRYLGSCCGQSRPGFFEPGGMPPLLTPLSLRVEALQRVFEELSHWSRTQRSGGLHVAGLSDGEHLVLARADVGRHNALDKLYGAALRENTAPLSHRVVAFSGRLSAEILWKVRLMGCPAIVSNAAPTSLGIQLAESLGITAIGFIRDNELSIFSHPERIVSAP